MVVIHFVIMKFIRYLLKVNTTDEQIHFLCDYFNILIDYLLVIIYNLKFQL